MGGCPSRGFCAGDSDESWMTPHEVKAAIKRVDRGGEGGSQPSPHFIPLRISC
jgi:hypothetical protein